MINTQEYVILKKMENKIIEYGDIYRAYLDNKELFQVNVVPRDFDIKRMIVSLIDSEFITTFTYEEDDFEFKSSHFQITNLGKREILEYENNATSMNINKKNISLQKIAIFLAILSIILSIIALIKP